MNCHNISKLIASGQTESQEVIDHITTCADCRQAVEFERWLHGAFEQEMPLRPEAIERVQSLASSPTSNRLHSLLAAIRGASIMKKTIWTTAGAMALALGFIAMTSSPAEASSPKAKFAAMKKALQDQQRSTSIGLKLSAGQDGKPKTMIYINGQLMEVKDGVPFEYHDGNTKIIVSSSSNMGSLNLEDLPPDVRKQIEQAISGALNGQTGTGVIKSEKIIVNGKEVSKEEADRIMKSLGIDFKFDFDFKFDEGNYSSILFGKNENTLLLTPKKQGDVRYALTLDPKTNLPSTVTMQASKAGKWTNVKDSKFEYKPKKK